jgi:hypothetical protein
MLQLAWCGKAVTSKQFETSVKLEMQVSESGRCRRLGEGG